MIDRGRAGVCWLQSVTAYLVGELEPAERLARAA